MEPHTDSADTNDGPETYTYGMVPLSPVASCGPDKDIRRSCGFRGHMVFFYLVHQHTTLSVIDYIDFMRRTRWKTYQDTNRMKLVGKCLGVF